MFGVGSDKGFKDLLKGIRIKALCKGEAMIMTEFSLEKGSLLPEHSHPYEQTGYLLKGRMRLHIGEASREISPGDSWSIGAGLRHKAEVLEDSRALEVFSPAREDYVKYLNGGDVLQ
jgi:quercetin dioxygenase-like cupin family protein